jgi:hypothetical protein
MAAKKKNYKTEPPWKFMAGLSPDDPSQMRRVMARIHNHYSPTAPTPNNDRFTFRSFPAAKSELLETRVDEILKEAEGKKLLTGMMKWFGKHYGEAKDGDIVLAAKELSAHVTWFVRNPTLYRVEVEKEKGKWAEFLASLVENNSFVDSGLPKRQERKTTAAKKKTKPLTMRPKSRGKDDEELEEESEEEPVAEDDSADEDYKP